WNKPLARRCTICMYDANFMLSNESYALADQGPVLFSAEARRSFLEVITKLGLVRCESSGPCRIRHRSCIAPDDRSEAVRIDVGDQVQQQLLAPPDPLV